jgi:NAD(P)-dependent dehydrogenase (short-subunit alcohol dehydrogenase family)
MRLTEAMMIELKDTGVKVFALSPSLVRTAMVEPLLNSEEGQRYHGDRLLSAIERGEDVPPTMAAEVAAELVSGKFDKLAGRAVMANRDNLHELAERVDEIVERDLRVLRLTGYP